MKEMCSLKWINILVKMFRININTILIAYILFLPFKAYAVENNDKTIASYEMLLEEIDNITEVGTIVLTKDIIVDEAIKINKDKNIIIKANVEESVSIISGSNDYIFFITNGSELSLEGIRLVHHNENGATLNEGTLILRSCEEFNDTDYVRSDIENKDTQKDDVSDTFSVLDLAFLVISWSGFALAFLTIVAGILSFMGFKEIKDLQKGRDDVKELQEKYHEEVNKIENLELVGKKQIEVLEKRFEDEAQSIMYATHFYSMGLEAYKMAKYRDAIQYLKNSIKYFQKNTDAICLIGRAYSFIGQGDISIEYYQQALEIDDNCAAAFRGLSALNRYKNPIMALDYAKKAVDNKPDDPEILNYYGQLLRDNNKISDAMEVYLSSYSIKKFPDTCFFLSVLYLAEHSYGRACKFIQEAIDGYNNEDEFGVSKPVWKEMAIWVQILAKISQSNRFDDALKQLGKVKARIDTDKTKYVVMGHIEFVLRSIKKEEDYINESKERIR